MLIYQPLNSYYFKLTYVCLCPEVLALPGDGITGGDELGCACWELNLGLLQEQY